MDSHSHNQSSSDTESRAVPLQQLRVLYKHYVVWCTVWPANSPVPGITVDEMGCQLYDTDKFIFIS